MSATANSSLENSAFAHQARSYSDGTDATDDVSITEFDLSEMKKSSSNIGQEGRDMSEPDLEIGQSRRTAFAQSRTQPQPTQSRRCSPTHSRRLSLDESRHTLGQKFYVNGHVHEKTMSNFQNKSYTQKQRAKRSTLEMVKQNNWKFRHWMRYSLWTMWAIVVMHVFGLGSWAFPDGNDPACPSDNPDKNKATCGMEESLSMGSKNLSFLTSFVLAGFLMSSRNQWLKRRTSYCMLCGATRNLLLNTISLVPPSYRNLFARWIVLGYELSVLKARLLIDSNEGKKYLISLGLTNDDEWESMVDGDRHTTVWFWVQSKARELNDQGEIKNHNFPTICFAITQIRDKANDLMSCIDRDQPPPYVFVCALLVNINLFFYATAQGFKLAVWMADAGGWSIWLEPRLYVNLVIVYLFTTIFAMLFDVSSLLYNPFGPRNIDIPHSKVGEGIRKLAKSLAAETSFESAEQLDGFGKSMSMNTSLHGSAFYAEQNVQMSSAQLGQATLLPNLGTKMRNNGFFENQDDFYQQTSSRKVSIHGISTPGLQRQHASRRLCGDAEPEPSFQKQKASRRLMVDTKSISGLIPSQHSNDDQEPIQKPSNESSSISSSENRDFRQRFLAEIKSVSDLQPQKPSLKFLTRSMSGTAFKRQNSCSSRAA